MRMANGLPTEDLNLFLWRCLFQILLGHSQFFLNFFLPCNNLDAPRFRKYHTLLDEILVIHAPTPTVGIRQGCATATTHRQSESYTRAAVVAHPCLILLRASEPDKQSGVKA